MKSPLFCSLLIFGLFSPLTMGRANAQGAFGRPGGFGRPIGGVGGVGGLGYPNRPVVSPYINLLRQNNNNGFNGINQTVLNYYGLVRPQLATQLSLDTLQQQISMNEQLLAERDGIGLSGVSGHPAYFLNTGGYFQSSRGGGGARNTGMGGAGTGAGATSSSGGRPASKGR